MSGRVCKCGCRTSLAGMRSDAVWATASCESAFRRGLAPAQRRKPSPGGPQLSYSKALRNLAEDLTEFVELHRIEVSLRRSLPDRQRQRLENRP